MFETIAKGSELPGQIKAQIGRLQIPFVKVALLDRTFFDRTDHPARRLLNRLADAAIGWADDEPRTPDSLYGRIKRVVDRVIGEFERDLTLFDQLDAEFTASHQDELARVRIQEANVCSIATGKDRMVVARRKAQRAIAERLEQAPRVPVAVESLLQEGWSEVLVAAYLSGGGGGKEWRTAVEVIDRLLWSIRAKVEDDERRALLRGVPELLRSLRAGLTARRLRSAAPGALVQGASAAAHGGAAWAGWYRDGCSRHEASPSAAGQSYQGSGPQRRCDGRQGAA